MNSKWNVMTPFLFPGWRSRKERIMKKKLVSSLLVLSMAATLFAGCGSGKETDTPDISTISCGKNNRYGHPNKEVLKNLEDSKIYRTDQDGSIMFKIKNNKLKIEICSP